MDARSGAYVAPFSEHGREPISLPASLRSEDSERSGIWCYQFGGHIRLTEPTAGSSAARWDQQINSHLFSANLRGLCTPSLQEGIPYQSKICSILHKYVSGALTELPR